jgi:hypothetical protein
MASQSARGDLRDQVDAAYRNLSGQLREMAPHLERSDAPGEWTTREVLSHLLFQPGFNPVTLLKTFADRELPLVEITPGGTYLDDRRRKMTLPEFVDALDTQRRTVLEYLASLTEAQLTHRARIPIFKQFMGTDEITIPMFVGALFGYHWNDHAGQLAKIRRAVGLADTGDAVKPSGIPI